MLWMRSGPATASTPDFSINLCAAPIYQLAWRAATWQEPSRPPARAARRLFAIAIIVNAFFVSTASQLRGQDVERIEVSGDNKTPAKKNQVDETIVFSR